MANQKFQILLTNDDGIQSPGLWAGAEALSELGYVTVAAPREQSSGTGRSIPVTSDGKIYPEKLTVHGKEWTVYAVNGTPAQAVLHGILEITPTPPDLIVSGINYGENIGSGITASGTVGAALEGAGNGIPSIAISLQTPMGLYLTYSREVDFTIAGHFLKLFAKMMLEHSLPEDVDLLNINIPADATTQTPWAITRLSRHRYFEVLRPNRASWDEPTMVSYDVLQDASTLPEDTDVYTMRVKRQVSVTPLSMDMTARVNLDDLNRDLHNHHTPESE